MRADLSMWLEFLAYPTAYCRPFMDFSSTLDAVKLNFYTDASKGVGIGGYSDRDWMHGEWDPQFMDKVDPSIAYLELYAVTIALTLWMHKYQNKGILIYCDNEGAVKIINSATSKCKNCMVLVRRMTLLSMKLNIWVFAQHIRGVDNEKSDLLSRGKINVFKDKYGHLFNSEETPLTVDLWPVSKIWMS